MKTQAIIQFCNWLEETPVSQWIQSTPWVVPSVQVVHILAIAAVMSSMLMIALKLLGLIGRDQTMARVCSRFAPVVWWSLPVLLATGAVMIIGEPFRSLANWIFQLKMLILIAALVALWRIQAPLAGNAAARDSGGGAIAIASLLLWTGVVFAGRWIAYQ